MKSSSDPREWYRQEELARSRARQRMSGARKPGTLVPVYILAGLIAVGVVYLLLIVANVPIPGLRP